jgi:hypothetical protein
LVCFNQRNLAQILIIRKFFFNFFSNRVERLEYVLDVEVVIYAAKFSDRVHCKDWRTHVNTFEIGLRGGDAAKRRAARKVAPIGKTLHWRPGNLRQLRKNCRALRVGAVFLVGVVLDYGAFVDDWMVGGATHL